jgi:hypothetical protein
VNSKTIDRNEINLTNQRLAETHVNQATSSPAVQTFTSAHFSAVNARLSQVGQ